MTSRRCAPCGRHDLDERTCASCGKRTTLATGATRAATPAKPVATAAPAPPPPPPPPAFAPAPPPTTAPAGPSCSSCGRGPAADATFQRCAGYVLAFTVSTTAGTFCRDCAEATFRDEQAANLARGWMSRRGVYAMFGIARRNSKEIARIRALAAPTGPTLGVPKPIGPMPFARRSVQLAVGALALLIVVSLAILAIALLAPPDEEVLRLPARAAEAVGLLAPSSS